MRPDKRGEGGEGQDGAEADRPPHEGARAEDGPEGARVRGEPRGLRVDHRPDEEAIPRHSAIGCMLEAKTMYVEPLFRRRFLISENVLVCVCSKPGRGIGGPFNGGV